jgi:hypothetical protein
MKKQPIDIYQIKKDLIKNWKLVEVDVSTPKLKYYRTIYPESLIEIRTCLIDSIKNKSIDFVFDKKLKVNLNLNDIETKGLDIKASKNKEDKFNLISLSLKSDQLSEVYLEFIANLIESIINLNSIKEIISTIIKKINIWIKFFKKERFDGLSEEEIRGLIGELLFIKDFSNNANNLKKNILNWKGCENGLHDFDFEGNKVEIKTFSKSGIISISYPEQLDIDKFKNIFLACYNLTKDNGDFSLNELIDYFKNKIENNLMFIFLDKLNSYGYFEIHKNEYNQKYSNKKKYFYKINNSFPKILYKDLDDSISGVKYSIDTNHLSSFEISIKKISELFNNEKN